MHHRYLQKMQLIIVILFQLLIALYLSSCWGKLEEYWHGISDIYWLFSPATLAAEKISIKAKSGVEKPYFHNPVRLNKEYVKSLFDWSFPIIYHWIVSSSKEISY